VPVADLDLELDVFAGPFDLLMAVVLREGVNLGEVELGEVVVAYVEHLTEAGELDLEAATEFLVLIAALLELKSRLLLPRDEEGAEADPLAPEEAAEELLARMLEYARYRAAAADLRERFEEGRRYLYRSAPLPPGLRRIALEAARPVYAPAQLGAAIGDLLRTPPEPDTSHIRPTVSLEKRLTAIRELLRGRDSLDFDELFGSEERLTQAVTIFALLEMHKRGEATWEQRDLFGPIEIKAASRPEPAGRAGSSAAEEAA
jgi:segregation and condensation protein A